MMIIQVTGYADFTSVVGSLSGIRSIFYKTNGSSIFIIYAVVADGQITVNSGNLITEPGSFATDFPAAVSLTTTITVS